MMAFFSDNTYAFPSFHATVAFACAYVLAKGHKKLDYFYYGSLFCHDLRHGNTSETMGRE